MSATSVHFETRPLAPNLGARILGVEIARDLNDELFADIYRAFLRHQVLVFEPQDLPPGDQVGLSRQDVSDR